MFTDGKTRNDVRVPTKLPISVALGTVVVLDQLAAHQHIANAQLAVDRVTKH